MIALIVLLLCHHPVPAQSHNDSFAKNQPLLSASLENNNGRLRLKFVNTSDREFRVTVIIGLGDSEPREIGQASLKLPPQADSLFRLNTISVAGSQYSLRVLGAHGQVILFKVGPLRTISDAIQAIEITLSPISAPQSKLGSSAATNSKPALLSQPTASPVAATASENVLVAEVSVTARLLAGERETDSLVVAFELSALRPTYDATLSISIGKFKDRKPVSINRNFTAEFKLPEEPDSERIKYELTSKTGRVIAKGELRLDQLMKEDFVTVADIRPDKAVYELGETAKMTVLLEGKSPQGYRLEVQVKDSQGVIFFRDQRESKGDNHVASQEFSLSLPRSGEKPFIFEFKIFDGETGLLFDSGERDITINSSKN